MVGKNLVVRWIVGIASAALPAFSQSENPEKNEVSVQAFGSFVKSTTDNGIENKATNSGGVLGSYRYSREISAAYVFRLPMRKFTPFVLAGADRITHRAEPSLGFGYRF